MTTLEAIKQAVSETIATGVKSGDIDADSSWGEIAEYARNNLPHVLRYVLRQETRNASDRAIYALVESEIVCQAQDMRPL